MDAKVGLTLDDLVAHRYADVDGVRLHYVDGGEGALVVLLHGFPDFWYTWRHQIPALVAAGFRVIAPDQRGYALSDKPRDLAAYRVERLADDVAGLLRAAGAERASVVGHDWGGAVAWVFAMRHAPLLERLVILNVPHPITFTRGLRTWRQRLRSWYMALLQIPGLPELALSSGRFAVFRWIFERDPLRRDAFTQADVARYVEAHSQPGALSGMLAWYRALPRYMAASLRSVVRVIEAPTLVIWGVRDRYLGAELAAPDPRWVPNARVERIDTSHWVHLDARERVNELLVEFLR